MLMGVFGSYYYLDPRGSQMKYSAYDAEIATERRWRDMDSQAAKLRRLQVERARNKIVLDQTATAWDDGGYQRRAEEARAQAKFEDDIYQIRIEEAQGLSAELANLARRSAELERQRAYAKAAADETERMGRAAAENQRTLREFTAARDRMIEGMMAGRKREASFALDMQEPEILRLRLTGEGKLADLAEKHLDYARQRLAVQYDETLTLAQRAQLLERLTAAESDEIAMIQKRHADDVLTRGGRSLEAGLGSANGIVQMALPPSATQGAEPVALLKQSTKLLQEIKAILQKQNTGAAVFGP